MTEPLQLEGTSSLASLLAYAPQSSKAALDFSCLDSLTFGTLADACTQILAQKQQDADLRLSLSGRLRELERKIERLESEKGDMLAKVDSCKRNEEIAKTQASLMKTQLNASESVKRQLQQDLGRSRRENQALKASTRHAKLVNDRSVARQRERFADAAILAARNGCSRLVVVPGVFPAKGSSSSQDSSSSLYRQQISELETQRSSTLASNSAMRRLCTESINALGEASAALSGDSAPRSLQSDLFPSGRPLRKDYTLAAHASAHPAVRALSTAIAANEKALFAWEGERKALKDNAAPVADEAASEEGEQQSKSTGARPRATRIPLRSTSGSARPVIDFSESDAQERVASELQKLQRQLLEREADLKKLEDRLEEREQEVEEVRQRAEAAERRETEAVQLAREEAARIIAESHSQQAEDQEQAPTAQDTSKAEHLAEADFDSQAEVDRTASSDMSYVLESVGPKSSARRTQSYQPTYEVPVERLLSSELKRSRDEVESEEIDEANEEQAEQDASSDTVATDASQAAPLRPTELARSEDGPRRPRKATAEPSSSSSPSSNSPGSGTAAASSSSSSSKRQRLSGAEAEAEGPSRPALSSRGVPNQRSVSSSSSSSSSARVKESATQPAVPSVAMVSTPAAPPGDKGLVGGGGKKRAANPSVLQAALERRRRAAAAAAAGNGAGR